MKHTMVILLFGLIASPLFSQSSCPFGGKGTSRNDQYSKSSQSDMDKQLSTFQNKKRYQSDFKVVGRKKKQKARL